MVWNKEQIATFAALAWSEGWEWAKKGRARDEELHPGVIRYLREKAGREMEALDDDNKRKAWQIKEVI